MKQNLKIELNEQFKKALKIMEDTLSNAFITGKAGTGKSTLLDYFRSVTRKQIVVLAPTGVAAINVRGETIHSFFGFKPDITLDKVKKLKDRKARIFKELDALVIDEISMVRSDLLDCVDKSLRLNAKSPELPFGGLQMIFIGDLYQLPPVVPGKEKELFRVHYQTPYFFSARVFKAFSMEFIELEKIYRQKDAGFIGILNAIRNNTITDSALSLLNKRVEQNFSYAPHSCYAVHLTPTNKMAAEINTEHLHKLKTKIHTFRAEISGDFKEYSYPADEELHLASGAQVMLLNNDAKDRWVNGSIGKITDIEFNKEKSADSIFVELSENGREEVLPFTWELFHFQFNEEAGTIETEALGSFTQYPLRLAWAVTIHKSQGKTFDRVIIDMGKGAFAYGQTYVALSRCRSLDGITLRRPIRKSDVWTDRRIVEFLTKYQYGLSEERMPLESKIDIIRQAVRENKCLEIVYLKSSDEKSSRIIRPYSVGKKTYLDKPFIGVEAYCLSRKENRVFRVDRILEMMAVEG